MSSAPSPSTSYSPHDSPLPTSAYTDYNLVSSLPSSSTGWRHNIMKFSVDRVIDPSGDDWAQPVKMNRKDPRTVRRLTEEERERIVAERTKAAALRAGVEMDVDAKPKLEDGDEDQKLVKKEREEMDLSLVGGTTAAAVAAAAKPKPAQGKGGMFKKKTKRVFVSSEEARRLKREEWAPWVLEDSDGQHRWIGQLEGGAGDIEATASAKPEVGNKGWRPSAAASEAGGGGSSYVAFVQDGDAFRIVPIHRWYKFSRGPQYATLGTEEAEDEYNRQQKATDDSRWMMHKRINASLPKPSASSSSVPSPALSKASTPAPSFAAASSIRSRLLDKSVRRPASEASSSSTGKLKSVDRGSSGAGRGRASQRAVEQEEGEFDYDEEFADDEEGIAVVDDLADEQEAKELEEKIKREMRGAAGIDGQAAEAEEEDSADELTNTGKEVKKLVRKVDKEGLYESDNEDDDNPYYSGSEYDEETASVASLDLNGDRPPSRSGSATPQPRPSGNGSHSSHSRRHSTSHSRQPSGSNSRVGSRSGSPVPSGSGAAVVAKRATSPGRRSSSASRAASPSLGGKRKRAEGDEADVKRRKNGATPPPSSGGGALLTEGVLLDFLRSRAEPPTTQEVLLHFRQALKAEPQNKVIISSLLRSVADLVGGKLVLRSTA